MQLRTVDPNYLNFLRMFDPHVPAKASRPWLWPVTLNGILYGIPLTTQNVRAGDIGYLRCGAVPKHGLYLCFMTPIPPKALQPAKELSPELQAELLYFERNRKYIEAEAQILHRLGEAGQMDRYWQRNSCNFSELDSVYSYWQPGFDAGQFLYPKKEVGEMPVSKNGKLFYTKEQYEQARYNGNALEYARSQGYTLIRQNQYYKMAEHDSMVFTPTGRWFWNSRGVSGGALEFMMFYENKTLTESVLTLAGELTREQENPQPVRRESSSPERPEPTRTTFQLPEKAQNFRQLFYYLCTTRGLDKGVVQEMIRQNRLYQSAYTAPSGKTLSNVTFVYLDADGKPVGAYQRGMTDREGQPPYKRDVPGSDKRYGWQLTSPFCQATEVRVFEAAIDAASDASLQARAKGENWRNDPVDRLSMEGLNFTVLQTYLRSHPDVRRITLMLDGDEPGRRASAEFSRKLAAMGYDAVADVTPPLGKDWNDTLRAGYVPEAQQPPLPEPEP